MAQVRVERDFELPVARVHAYLAEHEHVGPLFGARVTRLNDGADSRNGVGSTRRMKVGPLPAFTETVTEAVPGELIAYRITQGSPLRGHEGRMVFTSLPSGGSHLSYVISFGAVVPGLDRIVAWQLGRSIRSGLAAVDRSA